MRARTGVVRKFNLSEISALVVDCDRRFRAHELAPGLRYRTSDPVADDFSLPQALAVR